MFTVASLVFIVATGVDVAPMAAIDLESCIEARVDHTEHAAQEPTLVDDVDEDDDDNDAAAHQPSTLVAASGRIESVATLDARRYEASASVPKRPPRRG